MSCSPILSDSVRMTDQTGSSGSSARAAGRSGRAFLSCLTSLNALAREPTSFAMRFSSSSKTSQSRLAKISGRMKSLYFGASFAPRIEHAASQIQDSRDLLLFPFVAMGCVFLRLILEAGMSQDVCVTLIVAPPSLLV